MGSAFRVADGILYYIGGVFWLVLTVVSVWRKGYVQNYCPLVANFGTRACGFAVGI